VPKERARKSRNHLKLYVLLTIFPCDSPGSYLKSRSFPPFCMYAIVDIAGFQEKVSVGDKLQVPLHDAEKGKKILFEKVLLVSDGDNLSFGNPTVGGASVEAKVIEHGKGDKIRIVKTMRRKRYKRTKGHRQDYTSIEITGIKR